MRFNLLIVLFFISFSSWASSNFEAGLSAYEQGRYPQAFEQFKSAADAGDIRAYGKLGGLYLYGRGTVRNYTEAYRWFGMALASGDGYAARFLAAAGSKLAPDEIERLEQWIDDQGMLGLQP